jgi:hypothetical protein
MYIALVSAETRAFFEKLFNDKRLILDSGFMKNTGILMIF